MAVVPLSGTSIRLMTGIPFNEDYKNTRWFDNKTAQTNYFNSRTTVHSMSNASFQRIEGRTYIRLNKGIDDIWNVNYLTFINRNKRFYAFVTKLEYINDGLTHVHFKIDVIQTWLFDFNFKPSYVVREHKRLWNSDGTPVINTIDEGLNYGTEYDNRLTTKLSSQLNGGYKWLVIVAKSPIEKGSENKTESKVIGTPQPLSYYITPFKHDDFTPSVSFGSSSESYPMTTPTRLLDGIYKDEKAVNNIVSIYITDYIGVKTTAGTNHIRLSEEFADFTTGTLADTSIQFIKVLSVDKFVPTDITITTNKYSAFADMVQSKLYMHPYTSLVFDDFRGNRTEYKLEYIKGNSIVVQVKGSLGLSNNVSYGIKNYNNADVTHEVARADESALISNAPSDIPVINDMLTAFLQGNRNSIQNQKSSVLWNGVFGALGGGLNAGGSGLQTGSAMNAGKGLATGMGLLGVASSAGSMVQGAGNTVLQLQGIQAKQKDIGNIPPQLAKQGSNTAYDYGNGYQGIFILRKQIKLEYRRILGDFFKMFGYKTNRVKIPNFHTRKSYNYVQTESCVITGNFNNEDLSEIKSVFDNGITLWHTNDVGNYELGNEVI